MTKKLTNLVNKFNSANNLAYYFANEGDKVQADEEIKKAEKSRQKLTVYLTGLENQISELKDENCRLLETLESLGVDITL